MSEKNRGLSATLIFTIALLGTFFILIALIPSDFIYVGKSYTEYNVPTYFSQDDIQHIQHFRNGTLTRPGYGANSIDLEFSPDADFHFIVFWEKIGAIDDIFFAHVTWEWGPFTSYHIMSVSTKEYQNIALAELNEFWDADLNASIFYPVECIDITTKVWITDSNSTRNDIEAAWNDGSLDIGMGFGFEDYETTLSAWDIVGRLLTFQTPEVFGATGAFAIAFNMIIALPIWAGIAYLVYRLILMAIPFLGG